MNIINGKKINGEVIDWYHLNLFCICHDCRKHDDYVKNGPHSCEAYPNINGIPRDIWNKENAECPYFEPIEREPDKNQTETQGVFILKSESDTKHKMKKLFDLIRMK